MWFLLLAIALAIVVVGGLYFRRRLLAALEVCAVPRKYRRLVGAVVVWLLYGFPLLLFLFVFAAIALGRETVSIEPTGVGEWLLAYPFWFAVLVMLQVVPYLLVIDLATLIARKRVARARLARYRAIGCLAAIALFSIYTPARILIERGALELNHYDVGTEPTAPPLRIVFLADLQQDHHTGAARGREVATMINEQDPDLILFGGDWINTGADHIAAAGVTAGLLRSRLGTYSVRGDHEHFAYRDQDRSLGEVSAALARHEVEILHNQIETIEHRGKRIALLFLSYNYIFRTPESEIRALLAEARQADYSILVTHQFDNQLAELVADRVDLALIGHTHGGQVNPVVGFVHVPIARVETPYIAGRYQLGSTTLIVTSGIGYSIAPFRYAAPASIEVIDLHL